MTWEPSRKTVLVLRTDNRVGGRSSFLFSLIVFRRLHVFKLCFLFSPSVSGVFLTLNDDMVFGAPGVSYCYSVVSSSPPGVFFMRLFPFSSQPFLVRLQQSKSSEPRRGFSLGLSPYHPFAICSYPLLTFVPPESSYFPNLLYFLSSFHLYSSLLAGCLHLNGVV